MNFEFVVVLYTYRVANYVHHIIIRNILRVSAVNLVATFVLIIGRVSDRSQDRRHISSRSHSHYTPHVK